MVDALIMHVHFYRVEFVGEGQGPSWGRSRRTVWLDFTLMASGLDFMLSSNENIHAISETH